MNLKSAGSILSAAAKGLFATAAAFSAGEALSAGSAEHMYHSFCASCHGPDMSGDGLEPATAHP